VRTTTTLENLVTTTPFCEKFGVARTAIPRLVGEGLPAFKLDKTRWCSRSMSVRPGYASTGT
jgi:hypothetical protein